MYALNAQKDTLYVRAKKDCDQRMEINNISDKGVTTLVGKEPAHIFARESFDESAYGPMAGKTDATNYQFGDWFSSNDGETMKVYENGNHMSYYVPGNLWIDPQGYGGTIGLADGDGTDGVQITVVVEGNIYVGDHLQYDEDGLDGVALIAIAQRYPEGHKLEGEIIPPDDPLYRQEGSGEIFFGDLNASADGLKVDAIMFAERHFADVLKGSKDTPLTFTISGLMAASGQVNLQDRGVGLQHSPMTVRHDPRLMKPVDEGGIRLPDLPLGEENPDEPPQPPWVPLVRWQGR